MVQSVFQFQKLKFLVLPIISVLAGLVSGQTASAWGGHGHDSICQAAVHLVKNEELKSFLKYRAFMVGHLCNIPDTAWRDLPKEVAAIGAPTHYIDPELLGLPIPQIPLNFATIIRDYTGKPSAYKPSETIKSIPDEFGSVWWRADQFVKKIGALKSVYQNLTVPMEKKDQQDPKNPYNQATFEMLTAMGLMGHYVGDVGQPYHNTADYDGYDAHHGGLHSYYEEVVVAEFDEMLIPRIVQEARGISNPTLQPGVSTLEKMRYMSQIAAADIPAVLRADPMIQESTSREELGMLIRTPAERQPAQVGLQKFNALITKQMGRSAQLLANLWDQAYVDAGKPNLTVYKWFKFPHTPDFVVPDYVPAVTTAQKKLK